jgi:hypothetical protein
LDEGRGSDGQDDRVPDLGRDENDRERNRVLRE